MLGDISFSPAFGIGVLLYFGTAIFLGFLSTFLTSYMLFTKEEKDPPFALLYSSVIGFFSSFILGVMLLGSINSSLDYLNAFVKRNPFITPFDYIKVILFSLLTILLITVPPVIFIRRLFLSRSPYKKVDKKIAIIAIACVLLIILAWVVFISWSRASGYNPWS